MQVASHDSAIFKIPADQLDAGRVGGRVLGCGVGRWWRRYPAMEANSFEVYWHLTASPSRPGRNFFAKVTLHPQDGVVLAAPFQRGPLGLGQVLVGNPAGFSCFPHLFA